MPYICLEARKTFMKKCNEVFGTDWSCEFSEAWKQLTRNAEIPQKEVVNNDIE